tara:strand:+ start:4946 stop:6004 length:1059 start_codon:yes stop_codon:yes gene_type:complete
MGSVCTTGVEELPTSSEVLSETEIPAWVSAGGREIYEQARELSRSEFPLYTGTRIGTYDDISGTGQSKLTEAEQRGLGILTDEARSFEPYVAESAQQVRALDPTYSGMSSQELVGSPQDTGTFDMQSAQPFLDIYQQASDPAVRELERQIEQERMAQDAQAVQRGAYGGSRQGIVDTLTATEGAARLADLRQRATQEGLNFAAGQYNQDRATRLTQAEADRTARFGAEDAARGRFDVEQAAGLRRAESLQSFAPLVQGLQEQAASGMITSGQAERQLDQMALDLAYADYVEQREYPYAMANFSLGALKGVPYETRSYGLEQGQQYVQTPSIYGQTIGGLGSLASAYALMKRG